MAEIPEVPKASLGDHGISAVRAGLGMIPLAGSAATELFNAVISPPLERRRDEWRKAVGQGIKDLQDAGYLRADELSENESFITTLAHASTAAIKNHQREKLEALRNAVLNSALPNAPEESLQQIFLSYVDDLTVWHLRLVDLLKDARAWFARNGKTAPEFYISSSLSQVVLAAWPELKDRRDFYDLLAKDLHHYGLSNIASFHGMMTAAGAYQKGTTEMGDQFLKFISDPTPTS